VDTLIRIPDDLQLEYNLKINELVQKTTTMELKFEYTQTYQVLQKVIKQKEHENDVLVQVMHEKDHEKIDRTVHSIEKLLEKQFPVSEIADCLGLPVSEIVQLIEEYKLA